MNTPAFQTNSDYVRPMRCDRRALADLLLQQWSKLSRPELEKTRYAKHEIAMLIEQEYGVHHLIAENYLSNLERALPYTTH